VTPAALSPLDSLSVATRTSLEQPVAALPLADLVDSGAHVTIACALLDDTTITVAHTVINTLRDAGVLTDNITLLCAQIDSNTRIEVLPVTPLIHDADDLRAVNDLGAFEGISLQINHNAVDADLLISIGVHYLDDAFASGDSNAVITRDMGSRLTQRELNNAGLLARYVAPELGGTARFDRITREGARRAGLVFAIDILLSEDAAPLLVKAGAPLAVDTELQLAARTAREASTTRTYDLLIAGIAETSLYRASRAAIQIGLAQDSALMRGGVMVFPVRDLHDSRQAVDANQMFDALAVGGSTADVIRHLDGHSLSRGESDAYLLAHVMQRHPIIAVGLGADDSPRHVLGVKNMNEAVELAETILGHKPRVMILKRALSAIPAASRFRNDIDNDDIIDELLRDLDL
jgi:hypothetical protein